MFHIVLLKQIMPNMSKMVKDDVTSPVIFLHSDGQQMSFFLRPGPTKEQISPLVIQGGGKMCRIQEPGAILLADPKDANNSMAKAGQTYISIQYIRDCVDHNQLLDMNGYVIGPSDHTKKKTQNQGQGRLSYTPEEDAAILKFIEKRQGEAKGIAVWKELEDQKLTQHTWQSMKSRYKSHLKFKLLNRSVEESPSKGSKRKSLSFTDSFTNKENVSRAPSKPDCGKKSPQKSTRTDTENSLCPAVVSDPQPSPERGSSPSDVAETAEEPQQGLRDPGQQESYCQIQEQETINEDEETQLETSPDRSKRRRLDCDGQDVPEVSNGQSLSLTETRPTPNKSSNPASKTLGILARAAREFEDSDGIDDESEEEVGPSETHSNKPSEPHQSSTAPTTIPESQAEDHADPRQGPSEAHCNGASQIPSDEHPGPSHIAVSTISKAHEFIFDSETQEDEFSQRGPVEILSRSLTEIKQHIVNLMRETKKDLVEVTKALLKANGEVVKAQVYLSEGYHYETHGPLWTSEDDEILLRADPYEVEKLQSKYGEQDVSRRKAFLTADIH